MSFVKEEFESAKKQSEYFRRVQGHLLGIVESFHKHAEKAHENYDLGFSRSYEQVVITSSMGLYRAFEDYIEFEFGQDIATYYSLMIAQNLFADLIDLEILTGNELTEDEAQEAVDMIETLLRVKIEPGEEKIQEDMIRWIVDMYERPSFNKFYYGFEIPIFSPRWKLHFCQSLAYNLLPHMVPDAWEEPTKRLVAEYLAANVEICCDMIISDIEERKFTKLIKESEEEELDLGDAMRFSQIYGITVLDMREIDKKLIANDEPIRFGLPEFGV